MISALDDVGLVARYWVDEAASGQAPETLRDSASDPIDLPLQYTPQLQWSSQAQGRSLAWSNEGLDGGAWTTVAGTKFSTRIDGATTATIEVVASISKGHDLGSRLVHFGEATNSLFSLEVHGATDLSLDMVASVGLETARWFMSHDGSRHVYHLVVDTAEPDQEDRQRLYVDGQLAAVTVEEGLVQMAPVALTSASVFGIGNRDIGQRSIAGRVHYVAIYDEAMSPAAILHNEGILSNADDAPP